MAYTMSPVSLDSHTQEVLVSIHPSDQREAAVSTSQDHFQGSRPGTSSELPVPTISPQDVKKKMTANEKITLIDVRTSEERALSFIDPSRAMPLGEQWNVQDLKSLPGSFVFYCRSGKRSVTAAQQWRKLDPSRHVYSLEGGILAWEAEKDGDTIQAISPS
jgi:rhodanese-related sulfurtransferase